MGEQVHQSFRAARPIYMMGLLLMLACSACSRQPALELPPTHAVRGTVHYEDGQPVAGAAVQFQPQENRDVTINGTTAADGSFTLETFVIGDRTPGATAGRHRVTILESHPTEFRPPTILSEPVEVQTGENQFQFVIKRTDIKQPPLFD